MKKEKKIILMGNCYEAHIESAIHQIQTKTPSQFSNIKVERVWRSWSQFFHPDVAHYVFDYTCTDRVILHQALDLMTDSQISVVKERGWSSLEIPFSQKADKDITYVWASLMYPYLSDSQVGRVLDAMNTNPCLSDAMISDFFLYINEPQLSFLKFLKDKDIDIIVIEPNRNFNLKKYELNYKKNIEIERNAIKRELSNNNIPYIELPESCNDVHGFTHSQYQYPSGNQWHDPWHANETFAIMMAEKLLRHVEETSSSSYQKISQQRESIDLTSPSEDTLFLFYPPGHRHSPLPSQKELAAVTPRVFSSFPHVGGGIDLREKEQVELYNRLAQWYNEYPFFKESLKTADDVHSFPTLGLADAYWLYAMMREFKPQKIIAIDLENFSKVMRVTNAKFLDNTVDISFFETKFENYPVSSESSNEENFNNSVSAVQRIPKEFFLELQAGDFLLIDSSHVAKIGSDVLYI